MHLVNYVIEIVFNVIGQDTTVHVESPREAKQKILLYHLWKSQLIFTLAEHCDGSFPVIIPNTSVKSQIMTDVVTDKRS